MASQALDEGDRPSGGHGILNESLRHAGGVDMGASSTHDIQDVVQAHHYESTVRAAVRRIEARRITT